MNKLNLSSKMLVKLLLALSVGTMAFDAAACHSWDIPCKARDAYNRAKQAADDAARLAQQQADDAARLAQQQADAAAAAAAAAADAVTAAANALAQQGAAISSTEMNTLVSQAKNVYADSTGAMTNGYNASVNKFQGLLTAALDAIWRSAAKKFVASNGQMILDMKHRAQSLDANGQAALNRVKRAIGAKRIDEQARADMQTLVQAIVYGGNNIGSAVTHSSFGIQYCDTVGAGYAGGETCYMMIMQTYLENGQFKVGLARSFGAAASPYPSDVGIDQTYGIFWGPGGIDDNNGASIGMALGVVLDEGLEVGVSWGIPTAIPDPSAIVPGVSISIGGGLKGQYSLTAGYTQVLVKL